MNELKEIFSFRSICIYALAFGLGYLLRNPEFAYAFPAIVISYAVLNDTEFF